MEKYVSIKEVSEFLMVPVSTIYHWVQLDYIPHFRLPKGLRFKISQVDSWMQRKRHNGKAQLSENRAVEIFEKIHG